MGRYDVPNGTLEGVTKWERAFLDVAYSEDTVLPTSVALWVLFQKFMRNYGSHLEIINIYHGEMVLYKLFH